jgi:UDP-N-acetylmuramoyl-L-alanyl-D-glutamate--2,6-diaminopimelate ligase
MTAKLPLPPPPVLVAGIGRAGEAALKLLTCAFGADAVSAWDAKENGEVRIRATRWRARGVRVMLGGDGTDALRTVGAAATIIKSPGIDMDVPLLRMAAERGNEVLDEVELGWRACAAPLVAVTGTNGKSTTCALIASVLAAAGRPAQRVGNTEFGPPLSAAAFGVHIVCEVSSFQLQAAPTFLPDIAIFTNLSLEHLPRHGTMEAYGATKRLMFVREGRAGVAAIVNADDTCGRQIAIAVRNSGGRAVCYGFSPDADIRILEARWTMREAETVIAADDRVTTLRSRLPGRHNALNIAAAFAYGQAAGLDAEAVIAGIESATAPPGRWELIDAGQPFDVVVDYAHTPDGIAQFLSAARAVTNARGTMLRTVFGPVGLPDPPKARGCAEAAAALSDQLVLTTGSAPRSHRILRLRELRDAARFAGRADLVLDRRAAIARVVTAARPGDVVAVLGLGALSRMFVDTAGTMYAFNDREAARDALLLREPCAS